LEVGPCGAYWRRVADAAPASAGAVMRLADFTLETEPSRLLERLHASAAGQDTDAYFQNLVCVTAFRSHHYAEAVEACNRAGRLDEAYGFRTLAKTLLAMGKTTQGLAQAEQVAAKPGRGRDPKVVFTLGVAQQAAGLEQRAQETWAMGRLRWPENALLRKTLGAKRRTPLEWEEVEQAVEKDATARYLAACGLLYSEIGMNERSSECYRSADARSQGPALAAQLVHLGRTDREHALATALAAVKVNPHVNLISAVAWLYLHGKQLDQAEAWASRALAAEPGDPKATWLMSEICGEQRDYLCLIEYRKRLGAPTHFNVAQYKTGAKAWAEQVAKNGLAAPELDSASLPRPPKIASVVIVPVGDRIPPELFGMQEYLASVFPSVAISVGPLEELQPGSVKTETGQVVWERLAERLRDDPGRIYVLEADLATVDSPFAYSAFDLAHARGAVSLARLRSLVGLARQPGTTWSGGVLAAVQRRARAQMVNAVGKLVGLSFPCQDEQCAMHHAQSVKDFTLGDRPLCARHQEELRASLAER